MNENTSISYRINSRNEITFVSDGWIEFASGQHASNVARESVLHRSLWDFIGDEKVKHIYQEILRRVNAGRSLKFNLRCDSPEQRRIVEISITPVSGGEVQFDSRTVWTQARVPPILFNDDARRADSLLIICSWCNKVETENGNWQEVEEAVQCLGLFELETLPMISHGMCGACYQAVSSRLGELKNG